MAVMFGMRIDGSDFSHVLELMVATSIRTMFVCPCTTSICCVTRFDTLRLIVLTNFFFWGHFLPVFNMPNSSQPIFDTYRKAVTLRKQSDARV